MVRTKSIHYTITIQSLDNIMFETTHHTLKILAAMVWCSGAVVLSYKSTRLLLEAASINTDMIWIGSTIIGGVVFGVFKAQFLFSKLCIKNLKRIKALQQPKLWQFYRTRFYFFLLLMVVFGSLVSRQAHGDYALLLTMSFIEISLATALLGSSICFWKAT